MFGELGQSPDNRQLSRAVRQEIRQAQEDALVRKIRMIIEADLTLFADEVLHSVHGSMSRHLESEERNARLRAQGSAAGVLMQNDLLMSIHEQRMWLLSRRRAIE